MTSFASKLILKGRRLASSSQTNSWLSLPAWGPPPLGCLATPSVLLGCLMTLVAVVAQGLLMKPPDQPQLFKTWKLTDYWTGILGLQATLNLLRETNSAPAQAAVETHRPHVHRAHINLLLTMLQLTVTLSTTHSYQSLTLCELYHRVPRYIISAMLMVVINPLIRLFLPGCLRELKIKSPFRIQTTP